VDHVPSLMLIQSMVRHCAHKYFHKLHNVCRLGVYSGGNGGKGEKTIRDILHISPPIAMLSNAIDSYLVFIPNVASIVHFKYNDNINDTNAIFLNGKISTGLPTLNGCLRGGIPTWSIFELWAVQVWARHIWPNNLRSTPRWMEVIQYLLMLRRN
jgi:hypothetical protein